MVLDDENPWDTILACTMYTMRVTVHTTTQYTPAKLLFGLDLILNIHHKANLQDIKKHI